jgi:hypothetical protein
MNDALIWILSIIGIFALYWALFGQWKYNKMIQESEGQTDEKKPIDKAK